MTKNILHNYIIEYLKAAKLMQVATVRDNKPWVCSVYFAYDNSLHLYWLSKKSRRHSQEIENNKHVAGAIVLPHTPGDKVRGIQVEGIARELNGASEGLACYAKRFGMDSARVDAIAKNIDGHVCYEIVPSFFVLFDEQNFLEDPRQEYKI